MAIRAPDGANKKIKANVKSAFAFDQLFAARL